MNVGFLATPIEKTDDFREVLLDYYETENLSRFTDWQYLNSFVTLPAGLTPLQIKEKGADSVTAYYQALERARKEAETQNLTSFANAPDFRRPKRWDKG